VEALAPFPSVLTPQAQAALKHEQVGVARAGFVIALSYSGSFAVAPALIPFALQPESLFPSFW
jgi:hypothetical protein